MNIDWKLLREQKEVLVSLANKALWCESEREALQGIIHFIDTFQDYSVDNGDATEEEVFGPDTQGDEI